MSYGAAAYATTAYGDEAPIRSLAVQGLALGYLAGAMGRISLSGSLGFGTFSGTAESDELAGNVGLGTLSAQPPSGQTT